jgi:hypothetical protein
MEASGQIEMTSIELRARVVEFGRHFSSEVERSADAIIEAADDPEIRRNALLWKMHAIPVAQEAVLQMDPLMALLEVWGLAHQMRVFFETGKGSSVFGAYQDLATAASASLVEHAEELALVVARGGEIADARGRLYAWAEQNPIETLLFQRASVTGSAAELLRSGERAGAFAVVGDLNATTREIVYRLGLYNEYLLKEVRWHSELFAEDLLTNEELLSTLSVVRESLERLTALAESLPSTVQEEREAVLEALSDERRVVLEAVRAERELILSRIGEERRLVLEAIVAERRQVLEALHSETEFALDELDQTTDSAFVASRGLVDHAFTRLAQLLAVAGVVGFVALLVLILVFRSGFRRSGAA